MHVSLPPLPPIHVPYDERHQYYHHTTADVLPVKDMKEPTLATLQPVPAGRAHLTSVDYTSCTEQYRG